MMKKLFGDFEMTWKKTIIFAILAAVLTAAMNLIPIFRDTSFQDIAISFECWIFFAVIIMTNTSKPLESALKTFVFFLISQPLIYLLEVPFDKMGFGLFGFYKNWILWTILTFPMAYVGNYLKKGNWFSLLILVPALGLLGYCGVLYLKSTIFNFPHHFLSAVFCFGTMLLYVICLLKDNKPKIVGIAIILVIIAGLCWYIKPFNHHYQTTLLFSNEEISFDESCKVYLENEKMGEVYIDYELEEYCLKGDFIKAGKTVIVLEDKQGNKKYFDLEVKNNTYNFTEKKAN